MTQQVQWLFSMITVSFAAAVVWVWVQWNPLTSRKIVRSSSLCVEGFRRLLWMPRRVWLPLIALALGLPLDSSITIGTHQDRFLHTVHQDVLSAEGFRRISQLYEDGFLRVEPSVRAEGLRPELAYVLPTVYLVWEDVLGTGRLPRMTSANDKKHALNSKHYRDLALDFSTARDGIQWSQGMQIRRELEKRLGPHYLILFGTDPGHMDHIHIQYDGPPWNFERVVSLIFVEAAWAHQVDPALLMGMAKAISGLDSKYRRGNRLGLLGISVEWVDGDGSELLDPRINVGHGARILKERLGRFNGDIDRALASWISKDHNELRSRRLWWRDPEARRFADAVQVFAREYRELGLQNRTAAARF